MEVNMQQGGGRYSALWLYMWCFEMLESKVWVLMLIKSKSDWLVFSEQGASVPREWNITLVNWRQEGVKSIFGGQWDVSETTD